MSPLRLTASGSRESQMSPDTRAPEYKEVDQNVDLTATQHPTLPARRARQGVTGHNVRYVLGFGLAGVIVAFIIVFVIFFG
jgi:hypothetical protein